MRFFKTDNVPYQMVYDCEKHVEYTAMYDMLPVINDVVKKLKIATYALEFYSELRELNKSEFDRSKIARQALEEINE